MKKYLRIVIAVTLLLAVTPASADVTWTGAFVLGSC